MPNKQRLAVKIFRIIECEAEGPLAIRAFLIVVLTTLGLAVWGLRS